MAGWAEPHDAASAEIAGRYQLRGLLGRGGMAEVFAAHDRATGDDVAVKIFRPGIEPADARGRRRREADLMRTLCHPGLVQVLDADLQDDPDRPPSADRPYLVMELVRGESLAARLRRGATTEGEVVALGFALCSTLAYIHRLGILHRDVKPANILLPDRTTDAADGAEPPMPKLADFGVARAVDSTRMTAEGFTIGTANYLSPEQVTGAEVGTAGDVYSLGLVLIEALTGEPAYAGHGVEAAVARLHRDPALPRGAAPGLRALLQRMTDRDPDRRPPALVAARQLAALARLPHDHRLLAAEQATGVLLTAGRPRPRPAAAVWSTPRRRRIAVSSGGAVMVAAAAAVVLATWTQDTSPSDAAPAHSSTSKRVPAAAPASSTPTTSAPAVPVPVTTTPSTTRVVARHQLAVPTARTATTHPHVPPGKKAKKAHKAKEPGPHRHPAPHHPRG